MIKTRKDFYKTIYLLFELLKNEDPNAVMIIEKLKEMGCNIDPKEIVDRAYGEISNIAGRYVRKDLDPAARRLYSIAINEFYSNAGYVHESERPDHIITMLAFMIQLLNEEEVFALVENKGEVDRIRRIQHRFLKVHLIPLLENYDEETPLKPLIKCMEKYVKDDASFLFNLLMSK